MLIDCENLQNTEQHIKPLDNPCTSRPSLSVSSLMNTQHISFLRVFLPGAWNEWQKVTTNKTYRRSCVSGRPSLLVLADDHWSVALESVTSRRTSARRNSYWLSLRWSTECFK